MKKIDFEVPALEKAEFGKFVAGDSYESSAGQGQPGVRPF